MADLEITRCQASDFQSVYATNGGTDKQPDSFHFRFNPNGDGVIRAIAEAVALVHNTEVTEIAPLAESVDPDALTKILKGDSVEIEFTYEGLEVTVTSDGDIWLQWL